MFDNVKSMEAFKQKTDFCGGDVPYIIRRGTDIDFLYRLVNDRLVAIEEKKDTINHSVKNIINSRQWQDYRDAMKTTTYLVYATHDREIHENEDIPIEALTSRYMELDKEEIQIPENVKLTTLLNYLGSLNTYYIKVKYPDGAKEYALKSPIGNRWSCYKYWSAYVAFMTKEQATTYIRQRYKKDFNRSYIYEIWAIDENGVHTKIEDVSYQEESVKII